MERYKFELIEQMADVTRLTTIALINAEYSEKAKVATEPYFQYIKETMPDLRNAILKIIEHQHEVHFNHDK